MKTYTIETYKKGRELKKMKNDAHWHKTKRMAQQHCYDAFLWDDELHVIIDGVKHQCTT